MKDYFMLFRGGLDFTKAPPDQVQQVILKWRNWVEELTKKGVYNGGERFTRNEAAVIKGSGMQVSNGPYTGGGEIVGGYIGIKAAHLQEAIEIAKDCPIFSFDGQVEIREIAKI